MLKSFIHPSGGSISMRKGLLGRGSTEAAAVPSPAAAATAPATAGGSATTPTAAAGPPVPSFGSLGAFGRPPPLASSGGSQVINPIHAAAAAKGNAAPVTTSTTAAPATASAAPVALPLAAAAAQAGASSAVASLPSPSPAAKAAALKDEKEFEHFLEASNFVNPLKAPPRVPLHGPQPPSQPQTPAQSQPPSDPQATLQQQHQQSATSPFATPGITVPADVPSAAAAQWPSITMLENLRHGGASAEATLQPQTDGVAAPPGPTQPQPQPAALPGVTQAQPLNLPSQFAISILKTRRCDIDIVFSSLSCRCLHHLV